jgi:hypothetical protein
VAAARISNGRLACDLDGRMALAGRVRVDLLARLLAEPYYARSGPKSTGRELFDRHYMARHVAGLGVSDVDLMATLTELTARTVAEACLREGVVEVVAEAEAAEAVAVGAAVGAASFVGAEPAEAFSFKGVEYWDPFYGLEPVSWAILIFCIVGYGDVGCVGVLMGCVKGGER